MMHHPYDEISILVAQAGPLEGQQWALEGTLIIGRDAQADIIVQTPDKQVSRQHASLSLTPEGIELRDLKSKNGTQLNGEFLTEPRILKDGDSFQIAMAQKFIFLSSDSTVPLQAGELTPLYSDSQRLRIDNSARRVWVDGVELSPPLSLAQFTMLELLYEQNGKVVSRFELFKAIWGEGDSYDISNQALDALVRRLRDRLAEISPHEFIITVRGHGLRLDNQ